MKFRLKAFGLHLLGSATALTLILAVLYFGWYHWPGWYLSEVTHVIAVLVGVDVVIGPLVTLIIANAAKPRRELTRDVAIVVTVQLAALIYGTTALWSGRPLYYAFSENCLSVVQANDIDAQSLEQARAQKVQLVPHWYSLPRWIWAPIPEDADKAADIVASTLQGGTDVVGMPQYYKPWGDGLPELRTQLKKVDEIKFFSRKEKATLKERMQASGLAIDQPDGIALTGRGRPVLAVIDPSTLKVRAIIKAT
jgi:hypothetical protein